VLRGGAWSNSSNLVRSSNRYVNTPADTNFIIGFRVARAPL
jgi:formylglycine-generating enzyme required for sulfatase activity